MPKSGSGEPEGQLAQRQLETEGGRTNPPNGNLRSGACRKAEAVSPKANPPGGHSEAVRAEKRKQ